LFHKADRSLIIKTGQLDLLTTGPQDSEPEPNKINASTPYDFTGKNLTPYGGLLPVVTMLEKLGFQTLVEPGLCTQSAFRALAPLG
jgi:hypothetical protein